MRLNRATAALALAATVAAGYAVAQAIFPTPSGQTTAQGTVNMCTTMTGTFVACGTPGAMPLSVTIQQASPVPVSPSAYPSSSLPVTNSATGTTAAVVATLPANANRTTYLCGFSMTATATAATAGAATVVGTLGGTLNFVEGVGATGTSGAQTTNQSFTPCVPASAINTAIVVTSFAAGTGGIAAVAAWGYQL